MNQFIMMQKTFIQNRGQFKTHVMGKVPVKSEVFRFISDLTEFLFPVMAENPLSDKKISLDNVLRLLKNILGSFDTKSNNDHSMIGFRQVLPRVYKALIADALAIYEGDPAAHSVEEVIISYPGFYAIMIYRIAHELDRLSIPVIPRMLTEYSHSKTGIDINPKAKTGKSFCIDHGTGIVIGGSTIIGDSVKIYQGVTLGALSVSKQNAGIKRHPTIEDNAILYAGSTILGGNTTIGHDSIIGGNVWITHSVEPFSLVVNQNKISLINRSKDGLNTIDFNI